MSRYLDGRLVQCARYSPRQRFERVVRRNPTTSAVVAFSAIVVLIVGLAAAWLHAAETDRARAAADAHAADLDAARARDAARVAELERQAAEATAERARAAQALADGRYSDAMRALSIRAGDDVRHVRDEFVRDYQRAKSKHLDRFVAGLGKQRLQRYIEAFNRLFELHELDPDITPVTGDDYFHRALLRDGLGDVPGALADYGEAIRLDGSRADAYFNRGSLLLYHNQDAQAALADFDAALALREDPTIRYFRGVALQESGRLQEAIDQFRVALAAGYDRALLHFNMGNALRSLRRPQEAIDSFSRALAMAPTPEAYVNRSNARADTGDVRGAVDDCTAAIELDETHYKAWGIRGMHRSALGDAAGAMADFTRAVELNDQYAIAWCNRSTLKSESGDLSGALHDLDAALRADPTLWQAHANRAGILQAQGHHPAALQSLIEACRYCTDSRVRRDLAEGIRKLGGTVPEPR